MEEQDTTVKKKKIYIILAIAVILISASAAVGLTISLGIFKEPEPTGPFLTTSYEAITAENAYNLINTSQQFYIIDTRPCSCKYNAEHIGEEDNFEAILPLENDSELYNLSIDLIIYDSFGGDNAITYCERFVNHTYGKICYIEGGFQSWKNRSFPTIVPG